MANALTKPSDTDLIGVLGSSLYVGAKAESIGMVIAYCRAANLDPMQKPVHIVPMSVKNPVTGAYEWRDVIMPGVGLYRIQADRSGTVAGISEPEFGPDITREFTDKSGNAVSVTFPEWCKVTAKKLVGGHIVDFSAKEYWLENYATAGKCDAPNAMWSKRPRGQLAKCAESQVLRKGWPEVGSAPTAEEMEGKTLDDEFIPSPRKAEKAPLPPYPDAKLAENLDSWHGMISDGKKTAEQLIAFLETRFTLTAEQKEKISAIPAEFDAETGEVLEGEVV